MPLSLGGGPGSEKGDNPWCKNLSVSFTLHSTDTVTLRLLLKING
uniref:Uncharacterized protein n=1 Tax=Anguilla anguilla TaxID=7936 RepID=A0A0E9QXG1_ANGAN